LGDITVDGTTRVAFVPTISNINAPTTTELNAGILLQSVMTPDGLMNYQPTTESEDNSSLASKFTTTTNGRTSFGDARLRLKKQTGTDTAYNTLNVRDTTGYVVVRRWLDQATAWTSSQVVSVYPIITGDRADIDPDANSVARYEIPTKVTATPALTATIA
jgi:hypothetical protein